MTSRELVGVLRGLAGSRIVSADVVEVAPAYDHAEITSLAAATIDARRRFRVQMVQTLSTQVRSALGQFKGSHQCSPFLSILHRAVISEWGAQHLIDRRILGNRRFIELNAETRTVRNVQIAFMKSQRL